MKPLKPIMAALVAAFMLAFVAAQAGECPSGYSEQGSECCRWNNGVQECKPKEVKPATDPWASSPSPAKEGKPGKTEKIDPKAVLAGLKKTAVKLSNAVDAVTGNKGKKAGKPAGKQATGKTAGKDGAKTDKAAAADDGNPINALAKLVKDNAAARADANKRVRDFLLDAGDGGNFIKPGVDEAGKTALGAVAAAWTDNVDANRLATLYFVVGPGASAPSWAAAVPTFKPGMKWKERLLPLLKQWTAKVGGPADVDGFLNDAADQAAAVFRDQRAMPEIDASVASNAGGDAAVIPFTSGLSRSALKADAQHYTFEDLYGELGDGGKNGAFVADLAGPQDKGARRISVKLYTSREPDGTLVNKIGICDVTDRNDTFCRRFNAVPGESTVPLDDRKPDQRAYTLKIETSARTGKLGVTVTRPGAANAKEGISTSVQDLMLMRAKQAVALNNRSGSGTVVNVGGRNFYTVPQGVPKGALAFLSMEKVDNCGGEGDRCNPSGLGAGLYAEVAEWKEGRQVNMSGKLDLGAVSGRPFHLKFNSESGLLEVGDGPGDKPKPKSEPAAPGAGSDEAPFAGGDGESVDSIEAGVLARGEGWARDSENRNKLGPDLKNKFGFVFRNDEKSPRGLEYGVIVPLSMAAGPDERVIQYGMLPGLKFLGIDVWKHYLVLKYDKNKQYLDMLRPDPRSGFAPAGVVTLEKGKKEAHQFEDVDVFVDALTRYIGIKDGDAMLTEVPKRVRSHAAGGKPYGLDIKFLSGVMQIVMTMDGGNYVVWPEDHGLSGAPDSAEKYKGLTGPGNVLNSAAPSGNEAFPPTITINGTHEAKRIAAQTDIALYVSKPVAGVVEPAKHYVALKVKVVEGGKTVVRPTKYIELFDNKLPLPGAYGMAGLVESGDAIKDGAKACYHSVEGTDAGHGVVAYYQKNCQIEEERKGANCAGPIFWWGDVKGRDAALKACKDGKLKDSK